MADFTCSGCGASLDATIAKHIERLSTTSDIKCPSCGEDVTVPPEVLAAVKRLQQFQRNIEETQRKLDRIARRHRRR